MADNTDNLHTNITNACIFTIVRERLAASSHPKVVICDVPGFCPNKSIWATKCLGFKINCNFNSLQSPEGPGAGAGEGAGAGADVDV